MHDLVLPVKFKRTLAKRVLSKVVAVLKQTVFPREASVPDPGS